MEDVVGRPEVLGFFDGADAALCGLVRWLMKGGYRWHIQLVASKARITPKGGITTPRA